MFGSGTFPCKARLLKDNFHDLPIGTEIIVLGPPQAVAKFGNRVVYEIQRPDPSYKMQRYYCAPEILEFI